MKITRRQIRRIIKESLTGSPDQLQAAYAVIYTTGYLDASDAGLGRLLRQNPKLGEMGEKWIPLDDALSDVHVSLIAGARAIKRENPELDLSEENSILREGQAAGQADFRENIYTYIEQVESLVNRETPMGMSAAEGLRLFGLTTLAPGVLMADTAVSDVSSLIALMNDDNVLSWLDEVETMKQYGELKESFNKSQQYSIPAETYVGEWELMQADIAKAHPSLTAIKTGQTDDIETGLIVGPKEDLWSFESEYVNPSNYPEYRAAFERRVKPYKRQALSEMANASRPKLVPSEVPSYSADIKKRWEVMIDGEKIGELTKIDRMVRDGRHYADGFARERGWQAYKGQRPYDSRSRSYVFRRKQDALDWLMRQ